MERNWKRRVGLGEGGRLIRRVGGIWEGVVGEWFCRESVRRGF